MDSRGFQENGLIDGYTYEALSSCIYVGVRGNADEVNDGFICQVKIRPFRQMMRYARESRLVPGTGYWASQRVALNVNLVALQRDVLKERRDRIMSDPTLGVREAKK